MNISTTRNMMLRIDNIALRRDRREDMAWVSRGFWRDERDCGMPLGMWFSIQLCLEPITTPVLDFSAGPKRLRDAGWKLNTHMLDYDL
ncbi:MAG TPA: hypothetical protein VF780_10380 [Nitrosospira sp.]